MKPRQLIPIALIFALALILFFFYEPAAEYKSFHGEVQGTYYNIKYEDRPGRNLEPKILHLLKKFDLSLSVYDSNSIVSKINRNESTRLDKYFKRVFNKAEEIYHLSGGAFDVTVAPIVNAWGFGPDTLSVIDSTLIDSLLQYVGMEKVRIKGNNIFKEDSLIQMNFNAIAQGYSVDIVTEFLDRKGITNYLVEIGGELKAKGINHQGNPWRVGIDKPIDNNMDPGENLQAIVNVSDKSLATSGNYRQFYEKDGVKYVHSINPKTGYPILNRLLSVTVMMHDCISADAFATTFMVMGLEKSIIFLSKHKDIDAYLIYSDEKGEFKTFLTPGMKEIIAEGESM